jgi:hypothetical protein
MEEFWKIAVGIAGVGAIGSFVFYSLYRQWLKIPGVFDKLSSPDTYRIFRLFLVLTFLFATLALAAFVFGPSSHDRAEQIKGEVRVFTIARFKSLTRIIDDQLAFYDAHNDAEGRKLAEKLKADITSINNDREAAIERGNMVEVLQSTNDLVIVLNEYQLVASLRYQASKGDPAVDAFVKSNAELEQFKRGLTRMTEFANMPSIQERLDRNPYDLKLLKEYEKQGGRYMGPPA